MMSPFQKPVRAVAGLLFGATVALAGCASEAEDGSAVNAEANVGEATQALGAGWQWNYVPGAVCGNGTPTGFGINVGTSTDVLIYLEGGGICWDEVTCGAGAASYMREGYGENDFTSPGGGIFNRNNPGNPYRNSTIVYIPYCTGDFHSGSTTGGTNGRLHFNGRINVELDLAQVVAQFPNPSRVTLTGSSAGGFGSLFNYERVAQAFPNTRVDLVSDSAPAMWNNAPVFSGMGAWNGFAALPQDCPNCRTSVRNLYAYYANKYPNSRFAVTSFDQDPTMSVGYALLPPLFANELRNLSFNTLSKLPNVKHFVPSGSSHTMLYSIDSTSATTGCCNWFFGICFPATCGGPMKLQDWLTKMYTDDPTWKKQSALLEQ